MIARRIGFHMAIKVYLLLRYINLFIQTPFFNNIGIVRKRCTIITKGKAHSTANTLKFNQKLVTVDLFWNRCHFSISKQLHLFSL